VDISVWGAPALCESAVPCRRPWRDRESSPSRFVATPGRQQPWRAALRAAL